MRGGQTVSVNAPLTVVTGAAGFVGRHVARALGQRGHRLVVTDVTADGVELRRLPGAVFLEADAVHLTQQLAGPLADGFDHLIHLAALTAAPDALGIAPLEHYRQNLAMSLEALELARTRGRGRTILASSAAVFGDHQQGRLGEDVRPEGGSTYGLAKRAGDDLVGGLHALGEDVLSVRFGDLYGGDEAPRRSRPRVSVVQRLLEQALDGQDLVPPAPNEERDWTLVDDVANAMVRLLEAPRPATALLHLTCGQTTCQRDLAESVASLVPGSTVRITTAPHGHHGRGPLVSDRMPETITWTPLRDGLATALARVQTVRGTASPRASPGRPEGGGVAD